MYYVSFYTEHGNKSISTGSKVKKEAELYCREAKIADLEKVAKVTTLQNSVISQIVAGRNVSVKDSFNEWLEWMDVSTAKRTADNSRIVVNEWAGKGKLWSKPINSIKQKQVHKFINREGDDKGTTRRVELSAIRSFFKFCCIKGFCQIDQSQLVRVDMDSLSHKQKEKKKIGVFNDSQIKLILNNTEGFWHIATAIGRYTGLRLGDVAQLEWDCFNEKNRITVWTDKRDKRVSLPLKPAALANALDQIDPVSKKYCFPEQRITVLDVKKRSKLSVQFKRILDGLEIPGLSFHCLRHTYATVCKNKGIPMPHISESLGHSSVVTTETYIH